MKEKVDVLLDAGATRQRGPSTVVRIEGSRAVVIREGAISEKEIAEKLQATG